MTKEQKLLFLVTITPLLRDYMDDLIDEYPNLVKMGLKNACKDFIKQADLCGTKITGKKTEQDLDEVRKQYQELYMLHLGISKEINK